VGTLSGQDKLVCGVDFSGANKTPNDTWLAYGRVSGWQFEILGIKQVGSHAIGAELAKLGLTAAGIDCPFSLPAEFMEFMAQKALRKEFQTWQELAEHIVFTSFDDFLEQVKEFKKEPKRIADKAVKAPALSPLHRGNPSMVQMTYHGMRMLAMLDPSKFAVLPFQDEPVGACSVIEVYPREFLRFLSLPETGYKTKVKKEDPDVEKIRRQILSGLFELKERRQIALKEFIRLSISKELERQAIASDHALDAVICAYLTALFVTQRPAFSDPFEQDDDKVLLEGWIYSLKE
jgi:hypothetical protein